MHGSRVDADEKVEGGDDGSGLVPGVAVGDMDGGGVIKVEVAGVADESDGGFMLMDEF